MHNMALTKQDRQISLALEEACVLSFQNDARIVKLLKRLQNDTDSFMKQVSLAVSKNDLKLLELLLKQVNPGGAFGFQPEIDAAAYNGNTAMVKLLMAHSNAGPNEMLAIRCIVMDDQVQAQEIFNENSSRISPTKSNARSKFSITSGAKNIVQGKAIGQSTLRSDLKSNNTKRLDYNETLVLAAANGCLWMVKAASSKISPIIETSDKKENKASIRKALQDSIKAAAENGHINVLEFLMSQVDLSNCYEAIYFSMCKKQDKTAMWLLSKMKDIHIGYNLGLAGRRVKNQLNTKIISEASTQGLQLLNIYRVIINQKQDGIKELLTNEDTKQNALLIFALVNGYQATAELLISLQNVDQGYHFNDLIEELFECAAMDGCSEVVAQLLPRVDKRLHRTIISRACFDGYMEMFKLALNSEVDPELEVKIRRDEEEQQIAEVSNEYQPSFALTYISIAARCGHSGLVSLFLEQRPTYDAKALYQAAALNNQVPVMSAIVSSKATKEEQEALIELQPEHIVAVRRWLCIESEFIRMLNTTSSPRNDLAVLGQVAKVPEIHNMRLTCKHPLVGFNSILFLPLEVMARIFSVFIPTDFHVAVIGVLLSGLNIDKGVKQALTTSTNDQGRNKD